MDQLGNIAGAAKQVAHLAHEQAAATGFAPVPTLVLFGVIALFGVVALVVGGTGRRPRGAHRAHRV